MILEDDIQRCYNKQVYDRTLNAQQLTELELRIKRKQEELQTLKKQMQP